MSSTIKKSKIKSAIYEISVASTAHGLPNILRAKRFFIRLFWSLCLLASIAASGYFIAKSTTDYFNYDKITEITTFYEEKSQFPTISICAEAESIDYELIGLEFNQNPMISTNSSNYFEEFIDPYYNKCIRFNSGRNLLNKTIDIFSSSLTGRMYGLTIKLLVKTEQDFSNLNLFIHNFTENPLSLLNKGFSILSGTYSYFAVERIYSKKLDSPYNDCLKNVSEFKLNKTIIDFFTKTNRMYSQKDCIPLCRNLLGFETSNCGCNSPFETFEINCYVKQLQTENSTIKSCLNNFITKWITSYTSCFDYCPLECDSMSFSISSIIDSIPASGNISLNKKSLFKNFLTYEDLKKSYFSITVFYPELKYTLIEQKPKSEMADLVSSIGGLLGLFVGVSFLSFIEIFELIFEILFLLFENKIEVSEK